MARAKRTEAAQVGSSVSVGAGSGPDADAAPEAGIPQTGTADTDAPQDGAAERAPQADPDGLTGSEQADPVEMAEPVPETGTEAAVADDSPIEAEAPVAPPIPAESPRRRSGGFLMPALGGVVAAGLGFGAAVYVLPLVWSPPQTRSDLAEITDVLTAQTLRLDELSATVTRLRTDAASAGDLSAQIEATATLARSLAALRGDIDSLDTGLAAAIERFATVDPRLSALEKRPVDGGAASATALEAFGRDMAEVRTEIAAQRTAATQAQARIAAAADAAETRIAAVEAEAARLKAEAEAEAVRATALASLRHVQAALESGAPIGDALAGLTAAGVTVPPVLSEQAPGVPSLAALRDAYPPAARAALAAALRAQSGDAGVWTRLGAFLRGQSGARSLAPRAGDDPDAILSRAEAALRLGDLQDVIAGISELPPDGQAPMAEWIALANRRIAATAAVVALADEINKGVAE